ncbi:MAG: hypothetical protein JJ992_11650 [Planctomycetes bacterium]|nr:hypothetical protein [Planctomycetota bacterium]
MQDNPYDSPVSPGGSPRGRPTRPPTGDCVLVGLVWGGTIGAAVGTATAVCLLGWNAGTTDFDPTVNVGEFAMVEGAISIVVVRIALGAVAGGLIGVPLGAALGLLAAKFRFRNPRSLTATVAIVSAATTALWTGLIRFTSCQIHSIGDMPSWALVLLIAIVGGGVGGAVLGRKLSILTFRRNDDS